MFQHSVAFDRPEYLALLGSIPLFWIMGRRSLAGLGRARRLAALTLRTLVAAALVAALADMQLRQRSDGLTVIYVLDQSLSIPAPQRRAMLDYVRATLEEHADPSREDRFGVVAFAREAEVEAPPTSAGSQSPARIESLIDAESTDIGSALRRARAMFPRNAARRIVLITDGNENAGDAHREARAATDAGVSIDVVPVYLPPRSEISVEKIDAPPQVRKGQPFSLRIVLFHQGAGDGAKPIAGRVQAVRKAAGRQTTIAEDAVTLGLGKHVLTVRQQLDEADFYTYEARFVPDDAGADGTPQNNEATAFTSVQGLGRVLLIENSERRGEFDRLADRLRAQDIDVTLTATDRLFGSVAELQRYDAVLLANVSRSSVDDADSSASFSDEQIEMLVQNTREMGCGLVMLGGPDTFGAGGWANTKLEQAMPVDFQIEASEAIPVGALSIVLDRSGSMQGEKLAMSKAAAIEAVRAMGRRDYISVVAFDEVPTRVAPLQRVGNNAWAARRIDQLGPGGGTNMYLGMAEGFAELRMAPAAVKHMIVLADGQTPPANFGKLVRDMRSANVTVTAVAVGQDANVALMRDVAATGGGKFYLVRNPRGLPRIFMREVRRVAQPLVFEPQTPQTPFAVADHEILRGLEGGVPPIRGMVLTSVKENPLVEVALRSPQPVDQKNAAVLAAWTYGLGRAVAFTTDAGSRWASAWTEWEGYDRFFGQMVRWAMRPTGANADVAVTAERRGEQIEVVATSTAEVGEPFDGQAVAARALGPDFEPIPIAMSQSAPGRWTGRLPAKQQGSYFMAVQAGGGGLVRTGINVGYSAEYRDRETNLALLESVAGLSARDGLPGKLYRQGLDVDAVHETNANDPYRRDLPPFWSSQSAWPWLVVAGSCLFWFDVFARRVQFDLAWLGTLATRWRDDAAGRRAGADDGQAMARLRARKREVAEQLVGQGAGYGPGRRETATSSAAAAEVFAASPGPPPGPTRPTGTGSSDEMATLPEGETDTPTGRLLKAKRDLWRERQA
ncbi:MAG: VWA domain-containing protein [Pirellulales bacterium]|nr:VWA domain-containing protein [Pirellulales bacterium]